MASQHGHSHGLVHDEIKRSRDGIRAVAGSLAILGLAACAQAIVFVASGSIALLADLVHNSGDALTAVPLGIAFALRSQAAERRAGLVVVLVIAFSACVAESRPSSASSTHRLRDTSSPLPPPARSAAPATTSRVGSGWRRVRDSAARRSSPTVSTPAPTPT